MVCLTMELQFAALKEDQTTKFLYREKAHLSLIDYQQIKSTLEKFLILIVL